MRMKACLFDLDGVIVDTAKYHYRAWKEIAGQLGFGFSETDNEQLKGVSRMASLDILLDIGKRSLSNEEKTKWADRKNRLYVSYIEKITPDEILPGVIPFLTELKNAAIRTGIGSASKNTPLILKRLELERYFDAVIDGNTTTKAKPHPEVFLLGAARLEVAPSECVVFEDAVAGVEAARNAGMMCIGVGKPGQLPGSRHVIDGFQNFTLTDFRKIIEG
ncbi:MAG TPA: beta-phosphoglucomutase [Prolixibacteraceae bacterium]|nr:beta-phosphoglucomutase [Prolixibacteraceae bacterium]